MNPRVHVITLAVENLERALVFYRDGLGLPTKGVSAADLYRSRVRAKTRIIRKMM